MRLLSTLDTTTVSEEGPEHLGLLLILVSSQWPKDYALSCSSPEPVSSISMGRFKGTLELVHSGIPNLGSMTWRLVLVSWGCRSKALKMEGLSQQTFIFSQSWRPEVQDQGVGRVDFL